ncbi:polysaccharide pyruvyl transferase family protein [Olivibacter sp. SDN3]|uniref:polysaccharide pyruvyl transferase family protein n=1 Tax=Olivibacter sp. SDN3 TaxID=2764720 RepID=UPI001650D609|nr:polysaccharide pyruvyl transferase family protein [Olivibacter sp. SDN3]QNL51629.1 polysaccharide pyruvyl transferase family protein [Olivibacter sp. SDN3]
MIKKILLNKWTKKIAGRLIIFGDYKRLIRPYHVNLMYFNEKIGPEKKPNVGDLLSKVTFHYLLNYKGIKSLKAKRTIRITFIGSVIQFLTADAVVYGSGFLFEYVAEKFGKKKLKLDVRAVRGPLTREKLVEIGYDVPTVYGDPAILLPTFYTPVISAEKKDFLVIPHWKTVDKYIEMGYPVLSPLTDDWQNFINEIASAKLIISSSLHGVIIAEAYGVPAILLDEVEKGNLFKYQDYYYSTGRKEFVRVKTVEEGLSVPAPSLPDLERMKQGLLDAFPKDIFK